MLMTALNTILLHMIPTLVFTLSLRNRNPSKTPNFSTPFYPILSLKRKYMYSYVNLNLLFH